MVNKFFSKLYPTLAYLQLDLWVTLMKIHLWGIRKSTDVNHLPCIWPTSVVSLDQESLDMSISSMPYQCSFFPSSSLPPNSKIHFLIFMSTCPNSICWRHYIFFSELSLIPKICLRFSLYSTQIFFLFFHTHGY